MSLTMPERDERPAREPDDPRRAAMARRSLSRWAMRLALREWRQRILITALIAVASAATLLGIAVASATPGTPNAGTYGTASTLIQLPGDTPRLSSVIAKIEKAYGAVSVVYDEPVTTGQAGGADLRAQDPSAPYTGVLLALDFGHYPSGPGQVAVTSGLARLYGLHAGSIWHVPAGAGPQAGRAFSVTGIVEDPSNLLDEFALVAPGQLAAPGQLTGAGRVRIFLGISMDSAAASTAGDVIGRNATVSAPVLSDSILSPATVVLIVSVLGLVFIGLVATAAFTVMAQRRQRALGMLASLGATEADVRFVLIADGLFAGVAGAGLGAAAALGGWLWYYPHLEAAAAHRTDPFNLPWAAVAIGLLLAVATSVVAAAWPGRSVSKVPVVVAISGRVEPPQLVNRSLRPGLIFLIAGLFVLFASGGFHGGGSDAFLVIAGMLSISQRELNPAADVLTVRAGLPSVGNLALVSGGYLAQSPPGCPAGMCILHPVIQEVTKLPSGTALPNMVITERAVKALHETVVPVGWLVQAPSALTPEQVNVARQAALGLGTTVETKSGQLSLGEISNGATVGGLLLAIGVLAMTVGLIRGETLRDLRTLTAAGASGRTRRALAGVTAGVIAFLGAALGTVAAFLAVLAWGHSSIVQTFGGVPWADVGLLVIGMPLTGAAVAWLLGGRQPSAVSRQPLE